MITDIPSSDEIKESGIGFLNLAWDNAVTLLLNVDDWQLPADDEELSTEYWASAEKLLATAAALAQQGIEFLLKGRIAEVSPFLLLSGEPQKWPKGDNGKIPFADFRTIDAQDLIRVHDAVHAQMLSDEMKQVFEKSRRLRNAIFHTVDRRPKLTAADILRTVLIASDFLVGPLQWIPRRRSFLGTSPEAIPSGGDNVDIAIVRELSQLIETLPKSDIERFIGLKKTGRKYLCCSCHRAVRHVSVETDALFAQLVPNTATTTLLHCYACNHDTKVVRTRCTTEACKSNVIEAEEGLCCVCFEGQEEWPI